MLLALTMGIKVEFANCLQVANLTANENVALVFFVGKNGLDFASFRLHKVLVETWITEQGSQVTSFVKLLLFSLENEEEKHEDHYKVSNIKKAVSVIVRDIFAGRG